VKRDEQDLRKLARISRSKQDETSFYLREIWGGIIMSAVNNNAQQDGQTGKTRRI